MKVLMCPPDYYEVAYEINPWMQVKHKVDQKKAELQWVALHDLLKSLRVNIEIIDPQKGMPDMVFTANAGLVHRRMFIKGQFRFRQRRGEEPYFETWFRKKGYMIKRISEPFYFEGEGDALWMGDELYTGYHFRSDLEAHDEVAGYLQSVYSALELVDKRFYHLDTCFAPLDEKSALAFEGAFEPYAHMILLETVEDIIPVPEEEALRFACNALVLDRHVILPEGCPNVEKALSQRGFEPHPLDFSEFIKAGGAAKCLILRLSSL